MQLLCTSWFSWYEQVWPAWVLLKWYPVRRKHHLHALASRGGISLWIQSCHGEVLLLFLFFVCLCIPYSCLILRLWFIYSYTILVAFSHPKSIPLSPLTSNNHRETKRKGSFQIKPCTATLSCYTPQVQNQNSWSHFVNCVFSWE